MNICITAEAGNLEAKVDPRFGRCQYFIIVDTDTLKFEAIINPNIEAMGGAGIQSGQLISAKQVKVVITGNVGPNAFNTLKAAGVEVFTGASGIVKEVIEKYKKGEFKAIANPSVVPHSGMQKKQNSKE